MNKKTAFFMLIAALALGASSTASAAGGKPGLSGVVRTIGNDTSTAITKVTTRVVTPIEAIKFGAAGPIGNISLLKLSTLPGLSKLKLPVIGNIGGVPDVSEVTVGQFVVVGENVTSSIVKITFDTVAAKLP